MYVKPQLASIDTAPPPKKNNPQNKTNKLKTNTKNPFKHELFC